MGGFKPSRIGPPIRWTAVMAIAAALAACGGGGGSSSAGAVAVAPTPTPTPAPVPTPSPSPTPTPTPEASILAEPGEPALAFAPAVPASPQASAGGPTFQTQPTPAITFPILQSTLSLRSNTAFDADTVTMNAGSSFEFAHCTGCRETFALNVPSLGLSRVELNTFGDTPFTAVLADRREVFVEEATWGRPEFLWLKHGFWEIGTGFPINHSAYVYGYETPRAALPASGTMTYSGNVVGRTFQASNFFAGFSARSFYIFGTATVQVDFARRTATGQLSNLRISDGFGRVGGSPTNAVTFSANFPDGHVVGTTAVSLWTGDTGPAAQGTIAARFYGPGARELGLVWTLYRSDGEMSAVGSIGTRQ